MTSIATNLQSSKIKPFALICSFRVPSTELNPDFIPSVSVVVGHFDSQEQAKQARNLVDSPILISAWCCQSMRHEDYH